MTSIFKDSFVMLGLKHTRTTSPKVQLEPRKHAEITVPGVGKIHIDTYIDFDKPAALARFYNPDSGEVAWFILENAEDG